jgi:hypothetical protein
VHLHLALANGAVLHRVERAAPQRVAGRALSRGGTVLAVSADGASVCTGALAGALRTPPGRPAPVPDGEGACALRRACKAARGQACLPRARLKRRQRTQQAGLCEWRARRPAQPL